MVTKKVPYHPPKVYEFLDQKRKRKVREMRKLINKLGVTNEELGLSKI